MRSSSSFATTGGNRRVDPVFGLALVVLFVINLVTSPGHWWVQWPALGIGIAWCISLLRVLRAALPVGGLAALAALLYRNWNRGQP